MWPHSVQDTQKQHSSCLHYSTEIIIVGPFEQLTLVCFVQQAVWQLVLKKSVVLSYFA